MSRATNSGEDDTPIVVTERRATILDPQGPSGNWISLMLCVISISVDPLFFYIPVINEDCIDLDEKLGITAFVLRTAIDLIYVIYTRFQRQTHDDHDDQPAPPHRLLGQYIPYRSQEAYIDLLAVLPLPQVVVIIIISKMTVLKYFNAMNVLKYFVYFQFVPRVIRIYPLFKKATGTFAILGEVTWAKAAFNLYLYVLSGHVFGALWYFFAIEREIQCWKENSRDSNIPSFNCPKTSGNYKFATEFCSVHPTNNNNTIIFHDFGIYHDALESGVVKGGFVPKFMYCFRWGLQSLSCFAQNLEPSGDTWENIFTVSIAISSLVLFIFLIGNMQLYLQSETSRLEEMKHKVREIEQWKPYRKLSGPIQEQVKKHQRHVWRETKGVDVENLLNNLPRDLRRNIKCELCLELLKKVPIFGLMRDQILNAMCERLKHVLYPDGTDIIRKGDPIDEMLFIMQGELRSMSSNSRERNYVDTERIEDFCGEELSTWALDPQSSSVLPISTKTIRAHSKVQAFALMADDLKDVFTQFKFKGSNTKRLLHLFRCSSLRWRHWAACIIQVTWQRHHVKKLEKRRQEDEKTLQEAMADRSSSSSVSAKKYASRFAANADHARDRMSQMVRVMYLIQKPSDPDFTDEEDEKEICP